MPIGATIAAAATIGGAVISSNASKKASQAATQAADQNNQLQRDIFAQQQQLMTPYVQGGYPAIGALHHYLGLDRQQPGLPPPSSAPSAGGVRTGVVSQQGFGGYGGVDYAGRTGGDLPPPQGALSYNTYLQNNPDLAAEAQRVVGKDPRFPTTESYLQWHSQNYPNENSSRPLTPDAPAPAGQTDQPQVNYGQPDEPGAPDFYGPDGALTARPNPTRPDGATAPTFQTPTYDTPDYGPAPTYDTPEFGPAPSYTTPTLGSAPELGDLSGDAFMHSPGYEWGLKEGNRALNAAAGVGRTLQSGDAAREAIKFGQNYATTKYNDWYGQQLNKYNALRDQYNTNSSRTLAQFNTDRAAGLDQYNLDRATGLGQFNTDRAVGLGQYNTDRATGLGQFNTDRSAGLSQFNTDRGTALSQFNTDRSVANSNFDIDTARGDARYDADRAFLTTRFDAKVNDLYRLAGLGAGAAGTLGGFGSNMAGAVGANNTAAADARGNAAIAGANSVNSSLGNALNAYSVYRGMGGGTSPTAGAGRTG